jgi:hypothetical protein
MDERFCHDAFLRADDGERSRLCRALESRLRTMLMLQPLDFSVGVRQAVSALRALGHPLWSLDYSTDREIWGRSYVRPEGPALLITFEPDAVEVSWEE